MEEVIISTMPKMRLIEQLVFTLLNPLGVAIATHKKSSTCTDHMTFL